MRIFWKMKYALCKTFLCSLQTIKSLNRNTFPRKCVIASHEFACLPMPKTPLLCQTFWWYECRALRSSSITFTTIPDVGRQQGKQPSEPPWLKSSTRTYKLSDKKGIVFWRFATKYGCT